MELKIEWDESKCCHNGNCVRSLPEVFSVEDDRFMIRPEKAPAEEIRKVVAACPSHALRDATS